MFGGKGPETAPENAERPDADYMFADVFDEVSRLSQYAIIIGIKITSCCPRLFSSCGPKSKIGHRGGHTSEPPAALAWDSSSRMFPV